MNYKIEYLHLKVDDFSSPTIEELDNTVDYIDKIDEDKSILVPCLAGKRRTGTILTRYIIKNENECKEGNKKSQHITSLIYPETNKKTHWIISRISSYIKISFR